MTAQRVRRQQRAKQRRSSAAVQMLQGHKCSPMKHLRNERLISRKITELQLCVLAHRAPPRAGSFHILLDYTVENELLLGISYRRTYSITIHVTDCLPSLNICTS